MTIYRPWIDPEVDPVCDTDFQSLHWREAEAFAKRWAELVPSRVKALEAYIPTTPGYEGWKADCSRASLVPIGGWANVVLERRQLNDHDARGSWVAMQPNTPPDIMEIIESEPPAQTWQYINRPLAYSVLFDIGIYFGECLRAVQPSLRWGRFKRSKADMTYNSPQLLWPDGRSNWTPVNQPENILGQLFENRLERTASCFADLFDYYIASYRRDGRL